MRGTWAFNKTVTTQRRLRHECHVLFDVLWTCDPAWLGRDAGTRPPHAINKARMRRRTCYDWLYVQIGRRSGFASMSLAELEKVHAKLQGMTYTDVHNELSAFLRCGGILPV